MQISFGLGCGAEATNARDHPSRACGRMDKPAGPALTHHPSLVIKSVWVCVCVCARVCVRDRERDRERRGWLGGILSERIVGSGLVPTAIPQTGGVRVYLFLHFRVGGLKGT